jgi:hypothetical protein
MMSRIDWCSKRANIPDIRRVMSECNFSGVKVRVRASDRVFDRNKSCDFGTALGAARAHNLLDFDGFRRFRSVETTYGLSEGLRGNWERFV